MQLSLDNLGLTPVSPVAPLTEAVRTVLSKYGSDAHLYIAGPNGLPINGFQPGNYFDSAGTTLASVDGSVGLVLDAAGSVGAELVTNGGPFANTTGWTSAGDVTTVAAGGNLVLTNNSTLYGNAGFSIPTVPNATYKLVMRLASVSHGQATQVMIGNSQGSPDLANPQFTAVGEKSIHFKAQNATTYVTVFTGDNTAGHAAQWSLISVREVTGIHATQSTPGFKPTLRKGIVNVCQGNGAPAGASFTRINCAVTDNYAVSPDGTTTASRLQITAANGALQQSRPELNGTGFSQAVYVKSNTGSPQAYQYWNGSATISGTATEDWQLVSSGVSNFATGSRFDFGSPTNGADLLIWRPGLFQGTLTAAQIIAAGGIPLTTTAPASSVAGVNYLEFDGVDDRLGLPSLGITDSVVFVFAVTPRALDTRVIFSSDTFGPQIYLTPGGGVTFDKVGTGTLLSASAGIQVDVPVVLTVQLSGGTASIRKNGVLIQSAATALTFPSTSVHTLGAQPSGTFAFKGVIHDFVPIKGTLTLADVQLLEKQAAAAAGIQL